MNTFLYRFGQLVSAALFKTVWRREVQGSENVPSSGGVLLASNHLSNLDPPLIGSSILRPIRYFAKEELFKIPLLGWYISRVNAFPVKRFEHDVGAFKKAHALLASGEAVLMFPEGHRSKTGEPGKARAGAGMLACKAGVPVIPVCIVGSRNPAKLHKIKIRFGKPIFPGKDDDQKEKYQAFSERIMAAIAELKSMMYNQSSS